MNSKCALPPIQHLIGMTDSFAPKREQQRKLPSRLNESHPQKPDSGFNDTNISPSASSVPPYLNGVVNHLEQHQPLTPRSDLEQTLSSSASDHPGRQLSFTFPPFNTPVTIAPFPSLIRTDSAGVSSVNQNNSWQHHHYISTSSSAAFAGQPQDKYVCQTCNRAFSRPSSLQTHRHSHTGEKPFKCPHAGCGKAFSVRSNMKRHDRGCGGGEKMKVHKNAKII